MDFKLSGQVIDSKYMQACDADFIDKAIDPFTLVIFGGAGDLSKRKLLPTLSHLFEHHELVKGFSILGVDRVDLDDNSYKQLVREALDRFRNEPMNEKVWNQFNKQIHYLSMNVSEDSEYLELFNKIKMITSPDADGSQNIIFYMSVPPALTPVIVEKLKLHNLSSGSPETKILVEKPFGRDRASAENLNAKLRDAFNENQIYRIDHYLAKETVQNLLFFRFANNIFEPLWNRKYIDNVQISVAESIGIEHRGAFYEQSGVIRDIVQNHIMQLIAMVAMEPPVGFEADYIRDERVKIFRSLRRMDEDYIDKFTVKGQYDSGSINVENAVSYREEANVSNESNTPTFFAGMFYIDNWRWADVPFYIRTGKRLKRSVTEIIVQFKQPPLRLLGRACDILEPNIVTISIQPEEEISMRFAIKYPYEKDKIYLANMKFNYQEIFHMEPHPPYERLLIDCLRGDLTLFARQDGVEAMWDVVDPIIKQWDKKPASNFPNYKAGTWGPVEASLLLEKHGHRWNTV